MKLTEHGVRNIQNAPARIEDAIKALETIGGRVLNFYAVMGEYDFVSLVEGPNDEVVTVFALALNAAGNVRTTSLKVFSKEQFERAIRQLDQLNILADPSSSVDEDDLAA